MRSSWPSRVVLAALCSGSLPASRCVPPTCSCCHVMLLSQNPPCSSSGGAASLINYREVSPAHAGWLGSVEAILDGICQVLC